MEPTAGIIVPCFNEAQRINLKAFSDFISETNEGITLIFANDGSTDNTGNLLSDFCKKHHKRAFYYSAPSNQGKAEVIRLAANKYVDKFDYLGYFDADLATPLSELDRMWKFMVQNKNCHFLLGCRHQRLGVNITRSSLRHYLGRVFATFASFSLKLPVYDTQCGAKIMDSKIAQEVFAEPFVSKWFFDVEILKRLLLSNKFLLDNKSIVEFPLDQWEGIAGSKIKFVDFLRAPISLIQIHFHYPNKKIHTPNKH